MLTQTKNTAVYAARAAALKNHLLEMLHTAEIRRFAARLETVSLELNQILYEPNKRAEYAYFPTTAVVSLLYVMENGSTAAVSVVGNDGMIGLAPVIGVETSPHQAIVQCAGEAFKIRSPELQKEFRRGGAFQKLLLRFTMALFEQTSQTAVCNRLHTVEMQLCRWLLLTHDRLSSNDLTITHDLISSILGVSREGVTIAVKKLKQRKLIKTARGIITITDRRGMEATVCECYKRVADEYNRLLGRGISRTFR